MKAKELRELSEKEIDVKVRELRSSLLQKRLQSKTGQMEQPSQIRLLRHDIARILTVANEKKSGKNKE
ncbi:MAG: 50S ribosomal protein L29 [Candidatus Ancaeobacter aquaticus]|nr:50S ribosomal protein L29 [Candidatus Ancaeobacter aquaticus]